MSISRRGPVNTSTSTFPISTLQKQFKIYLFFQNQRKMAAIISISTLFHLTIFQNIYFYFLMKYEIENFQMKYNKLVDTRI